jgi:RNA polymerase sigma-70 factor (ECF subfamily)
MQIEHSNEVDLIRQTLAGDTSAFDQLVKTHRTVVYVLVLSYTKNPADAEDLTQRIFIRAYERLATLRELDRFLPWLQQIAHNTCKNWLSRRSDSATTFEMVNHADFVKTAPSPEEIALKREVETVVREAIGALQETDRKLVEGRYIEGASYDELQVESGLSYAAIANRLKRAKQQMRRRIEKLLGGMAILPGRTFIWGGIETVKLSMKAKLAAVGVVAVLGIGGGGVVYHYTFESSSVSESQSATVNAQGESEPEAVTAEESTVKSSKPPSQADIEAAIAALENLDATENRDESVESAGGEVSPETQVTDSSDEIPLSYEEELKQRYRRIRKTPEYKALYDKSIDLALELEALGNVETPAEDAWVKFCKNRYSIFGLTEAEADEIGLSDEQHEFMTQEGKRLEQDAINEREQRAALYRENRSQRAELDQQVLDLLGMTREEVLMILGRSE